MTWREQLVKAKQSGMSPNMQLCAEDWTSCAVGEQRMLHPDVVRLRGCTDAPADVTLLTLGLDFYAQIKTGRFEEAENILDRIEDRVLVLKRDMQKED